MSGDGGRWERCRRRRYEIRAMLRAIDDADGLFS